MKGKFISIKCKPYSTSKGGILIITKNSKGMVTVTRRYVISNGKHMINKIPMTSPNGKSVSATRVFDKIK